MQASQIYETVIYADDLGACAGFYRDVLGLNLLRQHDIVLVFECTPGVLLIFDPEQSRQPGRDVPSHGPEGSGHLAFRVQRAKLEEWRQHLKDHGVEIEQEIDWGGAQSIYFRDPAGNSLELVTGPIWGE